MKIPDKGRKKALLVVDMQPAFINDENSDVVSNVRFLLEKVEYDAYVEAVFSTERGSVWDEQKDWICPAGDDTRTVDALRGTLADKDAIKVHKHTRSVFGGDQDVANMLRKKGIEEVHIVGVETDDCVLATAFGAFDSGFLSYVLEECCASATPARHQMGLDILGIQGMTNSRCLVNTVDIDL